MTPSTYHTTWISPVGPLGLWVTEHGLARLGLPNDDADEAAAWVARHLPGAVATVPPDDPHVAPVISQLAGYFAGELREFSIPLDMHGTEFQATVWRAVYKVPWGQTRSYGEIAAQIGQPSAVRAVGAANGANPLPIIVPCHRIIASNGALQGYGGGLALKVELLRLEGAYSPGSSRVLPAGAYQPSLFS